MGVIQRQSFNETIVKFAGLLIGMVSLVFVYSLSQETYGYIQFLIGTAVLAIPVLGVGLSQTLIKFFPEYQENASSKDGFLLVALVINLVIFTFVSLCVFLFGGSFFDLLEQMGVPLTKVRANIWYILIVAFLINNCMCCMGYISNYGRIAVPSAIYELGLKVSIPMLVILVYLQMFAKAQIAYLLITFFAMAFAALIWYAYSIKALSSGFDMRFVFGKRFSLILKYSIFSALSGIGGSLAFKADALMITEMIDETSNGIYFNILVIAAIIDIPNIAINKIGGPVVAQKIKEDNMIEVSSIYKKSSINSTVVGGLFFLGLYFNIDDLLSFTARPESFIGASSIFMFLGLAKLLDGATGVNNKIIIYSEFYKYNLLFLLVLAFINVILNFFLINSYGIYGAAMATAISLGFFNITKLIFIYLKFGLSPFDIRTIKTIGIGIMTAFVLVNLPMTSNILLNMIVRSVLITVLFAGSIYALNLAPDINSMVQKKFLQRFR